MYLNQQSQSHAFDTPSSHKVQMLILALLVPHISAWGCLIRSDYNFVFLSFAYFYLIGKKDYISVTIIFFLVLVLQFMDLLFFVFVPQAWMAQEQGNYLWNNLKGMHVFAIFISAIVFIMKFPLLYFLFTLRKQTSTN